MAFLVDTNILVYRHDPRFSRKQTAATKLLRNGIASGEARLPYQAIVEFVAATTRPLKKNGPGLLERQEALEEAEMLLAQFPVLYPVEPMVRLAIRGVATYRLGWFDALVWACAEHHGLPVIYSEDFQHDRLYGTVRIINPFV